MANQSPAQYPQPHPANKGCTLETPDLSRSQRSENVERVVAKPEEKPAKEVLALAVSF